MVGNSSAALREGAFLGTPAVTVGTRQQNRERGANVVEARHDAGAIADAIRAPDRARPLRARPALRRRHGGGEDRRDLLATVDPPVQKQLAYDPADLAGAAAVASYASA